MNKTSIWLKLKKNKWNEEWKYRWSILTKFHSFLASHCIYKDLKIPHSPSLYFQYMIFYDESSWINWISGGVEKSQYAQLPKHISSRHGFEGCLASLDLSGESPDLISDAVVPSSLVESGCETNANQHPGKKCTHDVCANHGTCVQQWNSYTCDCDMTSFSGPHCSDGMIIIIYLL